MSATALEELRAALQERGLSAVWQAAEQRGEANVAHLACELSALDWALLDRQRVALHAQPEDHTASSFSAPSLLPPSDPSTSSQQEALKMGEDALRTHSVAILTVAGGQASRLGFEGPKGAYPLGPANGASLFQIFAEQIRRLRQLYSCSLPWIIQTGPNNHQETLRFFSRRSYFGLGEATISFVCQGTLPALSPQGQLLLAAPDRIFRNPDGHGGVFRAMKKHDCFQVLRAAGVKTLFYCQVDNPLVILADPIFLGHHLLKKARMSIKVVEKTEPAEKVGLLVRDGKRLLCVEYSDLSADFLNLRAADGGLEFRAGNIAIHAFELDFMEEVGEASLPLHLAQKKIFCLDLDGRSPRAMDGVKFETFVFDALPLARKTAVQLALRNEEFAPVKNRYGVDSIATARAALGAKQNASP